MSATQDTISLSVRNLSKIYGEETDKKALKDISFDLRKGETLGIIGRNGAGKSTLLKVLSQITAPTEGKIEYEGKLTSIIDIGTGFHPDLSGKENVYLSALLLGFSKKEIKELYPEIVKFSGLDDFMQMPVKHYSSGMYLRLAFSIAFHSKISVLLLDEVIAVGDVDFKRKCYSKLKDLRARGTSIILVSHHLEVIVEQCDRCILLDDGEIVIDGSPLDIVNRYYELVESNENVKIGSRFNQETKDDEFTLFCQLPLQIDHFQINNIELIEPLDGVSLTCSSELTFRFPCTKLMEEGSFEIAIYLINMSGVRVFLDSYGFRSDYEVDETPKGEYNVDVTIPGDLLSAGVYRVGLLMGVNRELVKEIDSVAKFKVFPSDSFTLTGGVGSVVQPKLNWKIEHVIY